MKTKFVYLLAGALALGFTSVSHAEDKPAGRPGHGEFSPEQREKFASELGLNVEELKKLTPAERMVKVKEASEKKITELQKKKADGTLTDSEKETLKHLETRKQMMEHRKGEGYNPEQRDQAIKGLGLNPDDLKNLPPEERMAKIKQAADKKYAELQKKQSDGTITDAEKETLEKIEQRRKWMEHGRGEGRGERGPGRGGKSADKK